MVLNAKKKKKKHTHTKEPSLGPPWHSLGFTACKAEQPLQCMELHKKEAHKD